MASLAPTVAQLSLQRYLLARIGMALLVLAWSLWVEVQRGWTDLGLAPFFQLAAAFLSAYVLALLWARFTSPRRAFLFVQLALDVALVSTLAGWIGGIYSPAVILYFPIIWAGAWLQLLPGAMGAAALCSVGLLGMDTLRQQWPDNEEAALLAYSEVVLRVFAFFLMGGLTGMLASTAERGRQALVEERQSKARLTTVHETLLDHLRAGVVATDPRGWITSLNPAAVRMLGEVEGKSLEEVLPGAAGRRSWEEVRPDGARWICSQAALPEGFVLVVEDITELHRMREVVARDERLAAVGRLAAGLAHEIRNPLAGLSGAIQMQAEETPSRLLELAEGEAARINRLVEDFLQISRVPRLRLAPTALLSLCEEVREAFLADPRLAGRVQVVVEGSPATVEADADRLKQVLWNLLRNAAQAMPRGGAITLRVEPGEGAVWVRVLDEGVGIPPGDLERIFDPFYSRREGGTGLGLAIVDQIIRGHGGQIVARLRPEGGSEFQIVLPTPVQGGQRGGSNPDHR